MLLEISGIDKQNVKRLLSINPIKLSNEFIDKVVTLGFKLVLQAGVFGDDYLYATNIPNYRFGAFECSIKRE